MYIIHLSFWCKSERLDRYALQTAQISMYHNVTSLSVLSLLQNVETGYDDHPTSLVSGHHVLFPQRSSSQGVNLTTYLLFRGVVLRKKWV